MFQELDRARTNNFSGSLPINPVQHRPSHINQSHWNEWVIDSAVDPLLTSLSIISLEGLAVYDRLFVSDSLPRRNDGRVSDTIYKKYFPLENGGWWCSGVDVENDFEPELWGQFKPDTPRTSAVMGDRHERWQVNRGRGFGDRRSLALKAEACPPFKIKQVKYEPPPKLPTSIYALPVPLHLWQAIATRYALPLPEKIAVTPSGRAIGYANPTLPSKNQSPKGIGFWSWVIANPKIPLIITEGAKKAGALITAGFVAIALPGIYNGFRQPKDQIGNKIGFPTLIPQLQTFATREREIIFCFDNDFKPNTVTNVRKAIAKTGKLFLQEGCRVSAIVWNYPEKGVDDLIATRGVDCFEKLYKSRLPLSKFNLIGLLDLAKYSPLKVNQRYLSHRAFPRRNKFAGVARRNAASDSDLTSNSLSSLVVNGHLNRGNTNSLCPPEDAQIIGLRSPKGTGKTEWLTHQIQKYIRSGKPVLVITHRIQLAKALCSRFGIDHIEEMRNSETQGILGYGLCIDSLHPHSQAHFHPEEWSSAIVILDECEQIIWHVLNSSTCQSNRVVILENLKKLLRVVISTGGKVFLSDADLSCVAIDYVKQLIDLPVKIWVVDNLYSPSTKRLLYSYSGSNPHFLMTALVKALERGEKLLVHTSGQKAKSKWGSINLESYLQTRFPRLKVLRIDSESVSNPHHSAYGCMANLNSLLPMYDLVICSPVVETGVSIDIQGHFDSVWCIAQGVQTVDAVCQTLERLRDDVPRHIWIKTTSKGNRIGNGSTSIKSLLASQHKQTTANIRLLQQAGVNDFDDFDVNYSLESLTTWAKRACIVNTGKNNYREEVVNKLLYSGYELIPLEDENLDESEKIDDQIKATARFNYQKYCQTVAQMNTPTDEQLEQLSNKKAKTLEERYRERKGILSKRYGIEVTPELVEKDDLSWYTQLQLHYYLTVANAYLPQRDKQSLMKSKEQGQGLGGFKPDINRKQLSVKVKALQLINIEQFFDSEAEFTKESLVDWLKLIVRYRFDLQVILGITVHPEKDSAIAVAQRILKKMGLKLEFKCWRGDRLNKQRIYSGCQLNADNRSLVFDFWNSHAVSSV